MTKSSSKDKMMLEMDHFRRLSGLARGMDIGNWGGKGLEKRGNIYTGLKLGI